MSPETKLKQPRQQNVSRNVLPYAEKGIDVRDIRALLYIEQGVEFSTQQISNAVTKARKRSGKLPPLTSGQRSVANAGRRHIVLTDEPIESETQREKIWQKAWPLHLRGGIPSEIAPIINHSRKQVASAISHQGEKIVFSEEEIREKRMRNADAKRRAVNGEEPTRHEKGSLAYARAICERGIIGSNLVAWNELRRMYRSAGRDLPVALSDRVRLEFFLVAREALRECNDKEALAEYMEIGTNIDRRWFDSSLVREENFIMGGLSTKDVYQGEDEKGLYVIRDGYKWYRLEATDEAGRMIYDNSELAGRREDSKTRDTSPVSSANAEGANVDDLQRRKFQRKQTPLL